MANILIRIILSIMLVGLVFGCSNSGNHDQSANEEIILTPTTIVNLRTGPGKNAKIIKGVYPGTNLIAKGDILDEWIEVETEDGVTAFVASKYVKTVSSRSSVSNKNESSSSSNTVSNESYVPSASYEYDDSFLSSYMKFMTSSGGNIVTICLLIIDILAIVYFRRKYDFVLAAIGGLESVGIGMIAIIVSMILTIFDAVAIFSVRDGAGRLDPYYILMLISAGMIMVDVPWRIRMSGLRMHSQSFSYKGDSRASWARKLGVWTWSILLFPISIIYLQYSGYGSHDIFDNSSFFSMVLSIGIYTLIAWLFCCYFWTYVVIKHLLSSMNSVLLCILNVVLILGIARYEYFACKEAFSGIVYVVSLFLLLISVMIYGGVMLRIVNEKRCSNCHSFDGEYSHTTDLGYSDYTYKEWKSSDTSNITPRRRDAVVSDAQRLVSTTERTHKWKTHHICPDCEHRWEIEDQSKETIDSHTVKRSWKETYLD